jgi:hypothetical protein
MKYTYDFEFLEAGYGPPIHPISIGICAEDGREYYGVFRDAPWSKIAERRWLVENVVRPHLPIIFRKAEDGGALGAIDPKHPDRIHVKPRETIAAEVLEFLTVGLEPGQKAELWAYMSATDHVCLYQLWGSMVEVPDGIPWSTFCLYQEDVRSRQGLGSMFVPALPKQDPKTEHHALWDAWHDMVMARAMGVIK